MAAGNEDDNPQSFILSLSAGVVTLVLLLVLGVVLFKSGKDTALQDTAAPVEEIIETETVVLPEGASIRMEEGVVAFYFASGRAELAAGAADALAEVADGVADGETAVVSGFHDATGGAAANEALARQRAQAVREVLIELGVPADRIVMQKPAATTGSGSDVQARRVEVRLID